MTKIALYGRDFQPTVLSYVKLLFELLERHQAEIWVYEPFGAFMEREFALNYRCKTYRHREDLPGDIDCMLSLGGDGTMLAAVSLLKDAEIPITGINLGRLGFLASIHKNSIEEALLEILQKNYTIQKRTLLAIKADNDPLFGSRNFALNDITFQKHDSSSMITVKVFLNDELLNAYWADGLIVATPTGSTAYSLSCGGPIILPDSRNFVITPISPHNLNVRPLVISDADILKVQVESRSPKFLLGCDSGTRDVSVDSRLEISKADFHVNLIRLRKESFFETLRHKLLWGLDSRN